MSSNNILFEIITRMEKEDIRKFSYITIFRKKYQTIGLILLIAAVGAGWAVFSYWGGGSFILKFLLVWAALIATAFAAIFLRVEYKSMKRMEKASLGMISLKQNITFYENYLVAKNGRDKESNKIKYDRLYQILESKDYYLIYANASSASMIRKKDIDEEEQQEFQKFIQAKMGNRFMKIS